MRVAILTNFIPPYRTPVLTAFREMVDELRIFTSVPMEGGRDWRADWGDLSVQVQRTLTFTREHVHPGAYVERTETHIPVDTLCRLVRYSPDVIVSGEMGARTLQSVLYRLMHRKCRLVIWATVSERTEVTRANKFLKLFRKFLVRHADAVLVNGGSGQRYIESLCEYSKNIFQMPYTIDVGRFSLEASPMAPRNHHRLLLVGQLVERKGILRWLGVAQRWAVNHPQEKLEIWVAGRGPLSVAIEAQALPANMSLKLIGGVEYNALPSLYQSCGIFAFPTLADEWGVVVNEAMAAGLPVLGSIQSQAVEELVEDGVTGWIFDPDFEEQSYAALEKAMAASAEQVEDMGRLARTKIQSVTPRTAALQLYDACKLA